MDAKASLVRADRLLLRVVTPLSWLPPLLARIAVGVTFIGTGWGKLHSLDKVTAFFADLHIPAPGFNAVLAASSEFVCGSLLVLGLLTRLASVPLIITMAVAILTAKLKELTGVSDFLALEELLYLIVFVWLAVSGPGAVSLDHLAARWLRGPGRRPVPPTGAV